MFYIYTTFISGLTSGCPVLSVLFWLSCSGCPVLAVLFWLSFSGFLFLTVLFWGPFLAVLFWLSSPSCQIPNPIPNAKFTCSTTESKVLSMETSPMFRFRLVSPCYIAGLHSPAPPYPPAVLCKSACVWSCPLPYAYTLPDSCCQTVS
jgi:hypothetical protein